MSLEVSIVTCCYRPGGIDVLMAGMRDQTFDKNQFEVILVDNRYERRHREVKELAREYGVNLIHVPEHRRNGKYALTSSAFNTGFALSQGRVIIMLVDYTYCPPGWIQAHMQHHLVGGPSNFVLAPYWYHSIGITQKVYDDLAKRGYVLQDFQAYANTPKLKMLKEFDLSFQEGRTDGPGLEPDAVLNGEVFPESFLFQDGLFDPAWLKNMPPLPEGDPGGRDKNPGPHTTWTHLKNESLRREVVYYLNGVDAWAERGGRMSIDSDFGLRVSCAGAQLVWEPAALANCVNPRHGICRVMPFGDCSHRVDGRWDLQDCNNFMARRDVEVRTGSGPLAAPAPYTMQSLAERLKPWRTMDLIDTSVLEKSDLEYYGRVIWPDSKYEV